MCSYQTFLGRQTNPETLVEFFPIVTFNQSEIKIFFWRRCRWCSRSSQVIFPVQWKKKTEFSWKSRKKGRMICSEMHFWYHNPLPVYLNHRMDWRTECEEMMMQLLRKSSSSSICSAVRKDDDHGGCQQPMWTIYHSLFLQPLTSVNKLSLSSTLIINTFWIPQAMGDRGHTCLKRYFRVKFWEQTRPGAFNSSAYKSKIHVRLFCNQNMVEA